ncbi:MAG: hypothetical protein AAFY55_13985 [Bacteroidota bacterium]
MTHARAFSFVLASALAGVLLIASPVAAQSKRAITINGQPIPTATLQALEAQAQTRIPEGRYFYDALSGAWGYENGPVAGFTVPGLPLPGPMPANISAMGTGTFINGRELHPQDVTSLRHLLGEVHTGRFWMDAWGNFGPEGQGALGNVVAIAQQRGVLNRGGGQGGSAYASDGSWVTTDGNGGVVISFRDFGGGYTSYSN